MFRQLRTRVLQPKCCFSAGAALRLIVAYSLNLAVACKMLPLNSVTSTCRSSNLRNSSASSRSCR